MNFASGASPEVVMAMSSAVHSLLGGLGYAAGGSKGGKGIEVIVKANGERLGNLCFQLQMTGYMVSYVRGRDLWRVCSYPYHFTNKYPSNFQYSIITVSQCRICPRNKGPNEHPRFSNIRRLQKSIQQNR